MIFFVIIVAFNGVSYPLVLVPEAATDASWFRELIWSAEYRPAFCLIIYCTLSGWQVFC